MDTENFKFSLAVEARPLEVKGFERNGFALDILNSLFIDAQGFARRQQSAHMLSAKCGGQESGCEFCNLMEARILKYEAIAKTIKSE